MYLAFVSTLGKIKILLGMLKRYIETQKLLAILTQLTALISILTLLRPILTIGKMFLSRFFNKKTIKPDDKKELPSRKYKKLETLSSCSACENSSSFSISDSNSNSSSNSSSKSNSKENNVEPKKIVKQEQKSHSEKQHKKIKKNKIKITKKDMSEVLKHFKLD